MGWPATVRTWGSTAQERARAYGCDELLPEPDDELFRATDVAAPAAVVFRWLCQLRAAPYSYDRLDNGGRRSPPALTPGLEHLEVGQRFMSIFRLAAFEPDRSITLTHHGDLFGRVVATYAVHEPAPGRTRLVAKLVVAHGTGMRARLLSRLLPPGDLVMMRRQLLNLRRLAEGR